MEPITYWEGKHYVQFYEYITCLSSINIRVIIAYYYTYPHVLVHFIVTTEYIADIDKSLSNVSSSKIWNPAFPYNAMVIGILITLMLVSSFFYPFTDSLEASSSRSLPSDEFYQPSNQSLQLPRLYDIDLKTDIIFRGLDFPTSMAFLGPDDILVLEKNTGQVRRITNGTLLSIPLTRCQCFKSI